MAARKRRTRVELAELPLIPRVDDPDVDDDSDASSPRMLLADARAERDLDDILSDVGGGDIKVKVSRKSDVGRMQACGELPGDTFSIEVLTDAYGGGEYLLRFYRGRGEVARTTVEVDPLIPARNPRTPRTNGVAVVAAPPANTTDMMTAVAGMVTMMSTAMGAMMTSMAEASKSRAPDVDPLAMLAKAAEILRPQQQQTTPVSEALGLLREGMKMGRESGGGDDSDSVMPLVAKAVEGVTAIVTAASDERRANREAAAAIIRPPASATAVVASQAAVLGTNDRVSDHLPKASPVVTFRPWLTAAMPFKAQLVMMAGMVKPDTAASLILDVLSDDQLADLMDDIVDGHSGDAVSVTEGMLSAFAERTRQVFGLGEAAGPWVRDVAIQMLQLTDEDTEEEVVDGPAVVEVPVS